MMYTVHLWTYDEPGEITRLSFVSSSDPSLPDELVDEGIYDGRGNWFCKLEV